MTIRAGIILGWKGTETMTDLPPMQPSAEERARDMFIHTEDRETRKNVSGLIREAYHDGVKAERVRIVAALREPHAELLRDVFDKLYKTMLRAGTDGELKTMLSATADYLDHQK